MISSCSNFARHFAQPTIVRLDAERKTQIRLGVLVATVEQSLLGQRKDHIEQRIVQLTIFRYSSLDKREKKQQTHNQNKPCCSFEQSTTSANKKRVAGKKRAIGVCRRVRLAHIENAMRRCVAWRKPCAARQRTKLPRGTVRHNFGLLDVTVRAHNGQKIVPLRYNEQPTLGCEHRSQ